MAQSLLAIKVKMMMVIVIIRLFRKGECIFLQKEREDKQSKSFNIKVNVLLPSYGVGGIPKIYYILMLVKDIIITLIIR